MVNLQEILQQEIATDRKKVIRIKRTIDLTRFDKTIAFGDTSGDKPMLEWADEGYFKFFH